MKKLWESVKRSLEAIKKPEEEIATFPELILAMLLVLTSTTGLLLLLLFVGALLLTYCVLGV